VSGTVLVAPHPDDEVLGGSTVLLSGPVTVVHVTDGVPPWTGASDRPRVRSTRQAECEAAWRSLAADVDCISLGFGDLRAWQSVTDIARSLSQVAAAAGAVRVYLPAYQRGHPDHDATFLAGALAAESLAGRGIDWTVYGLYGLDPRRRLRFGWLPTDRYRDQQHDGAPELMAAKKEALRQFTSQLWPGSALDKWLTAPSPEHFAPLPPDWQQIPDLPSFYDEQLGFARYGAGLATVEAAFSPILEPGPSGFPRHPATPASLG
jgi:LmbE family N-acetylglucosaminyl deacetylase